MNRIKSYFFTILTAAAFIYGSLLCTIHGKCQHGLSQESLVLFCSGLALIISGFILINLLIKWSHPEIASFHRVVSSACAPLLLFMGTNLITVKPFIPEAPPFSTENISFYFGVYLVIFGVAFLHFLLKD
ncbi:MAG: hypothetical protein PF482_06320 [Desulfobacteraceae bacterium]|jgi:hypothetical protein|nr:hypothetical protein [Desulfobacteraceae bacterium]